MKFGDLLSVPVIVTSNYLVLLFYFGQLCYNAPTVIVLSTSILYTSKQQRNSYKGPITNTLLKLQQVPKRGTRRRRVTVREQEAQLPQRNSASAAHMEGGLAPPALPRRSLWLHLCVWSNPKPTTNVRQARRPQSAL